MSTDPRPEELTPEKFAELVEEGRAARREFEPRIAKTRGPPNDQAEIERLRKRIRELEAERDAWRYTSALRWVDPPSVFGFNECGECKQRARSKRIPHASDCWVGAYERSRAAAACEATDDTKP